jgi:hypothetical protein
MGNDITFAYNNEHKKLIVSTEGVEYIVTNQEIKTPVLEDILEDEELTVKADLPTPLCAESLAKLSIALIGADERNFTISIKEGEPKAEITVKDLSNRVSKDTWNVVNVEGEGTVALRLDDFESVLSVLEETYTISVFDDSLVMLSDDKQSTLMSVIV